MYNDIIINLLGDDLLKAAFVCKTINAAEVGDNQKFKIMMC
ncbi:hypothetical protein [Oceanobacillus rekensis]|nr:hypothetical protein [Oceanobacillus rekensis]